MQLNPGPIGGYWTYVDPLLNCYISFIGNMDYTVWPPASLVKIVVDDVQKTATYGGWSSAQCFRANFSEAALAPTDVDVITLTTHPLFRSVLGKLIFPFDLQCDKFVVSATREYFDPNLTLRVQFQEAMNQTLIPLITDFELVVSGVTKVIDSINWLSSTILEIHYSEAYLETDHIDLQQSSVRFRVKSLGGKLTPPFLLEDIPTL